MKKGLSVLLIAAALFGFYGGATSLTDVLASKAYWEEQGEKSTADMNKLEDGLNQLKDNEKAYLDGQKQLADGEKQLADAEKQLADGEAKLADGKAELAKGYADYAAAPAKLAAGRAAIAKGENDLSSLYTMIAGMNSSIAGFETPQGGASASLKDGYQQLKDGRDGILGNMSTMSDVVSKLDKLDLSEDSKTGIESAVKVFKQQSVQPITHTNNDYREFVDALKDLKPGLTEANAKMVVAKNNIPVLLNSYSDIQSATADKAGYDTVIKNLDNMISAAGKLNNDTLKGGLQQIKQGVENGYNQAIDAGATPDLAGAAVVPGAKTNLKGLWNTKIDEENTVESSLNGSLDLANQYQPIAAQYLQKCNVAIDGYPLISGETANAGRAQLAGGFATIVAGVYKSNNDTLIKGLEGAARAVGISSPQSFAASMVTNQYSMDDFHNNMLQVVQAYKIVLPKLNNTAEAGENTLAAGRRELAQGLADYAAAPGKLADGEKQVADGEKQLADGYKQYEDGKKALADGKKKLAEYEDGEQQVRDGLATLMATKADPGLESILDRRNGDDKFDDANGHLQLNEGLEAVDTGRGYQADSGELITKEVTNRAVGTAAGLGAAVLAVLAAILSFVRKYKGAAISAVLAAIVGCIGAFIGFGAGEYYSDIAGSTIGNTPFIAAAVLAAVAAVFSGVHFTAKPEAKEVKETKSAK